ncbi:MAG: DNA polymerase III subunit gamma/tau, partial [Clostridiales bacterium]|nr:DNA polymerase III subunit gamma/tau [Clostridiales bacterium]
SFYFRKFREDDMEHIALYRLFRPMTFDEIVEQDGPVSSLRQAVKTGRFGHAYLFSGQRGTGKTSIAKVFSRAVNCENPVNGNPCNKCAICKGIIDGSLMDVIEMDAASNNSVDNIRRICEEVVFAPAKAKKKVYIIDEVHMLSQGAFNALLKTLEEPPAHVIFLFATTEPHKIPATILSRCQRFEFKRITNESIVSRLKFICDKEGFKAQDDALELIASLSDGAMRDAVSLLDQTGNSSPDKSVTRDEVLKITGTVDDAFLGKMAKALLGGDFETLINLCEELSNSGRDITRFSLDLAQYFRDLLVVRMMPDPSKLVKASTKTMDTMYQICENTSAETLAAFISKISAMIADLKWSPSVRTSFEIALISLCGRKVKAEVVPLVVPDYIKKQREYALSAKAAEPVKAEPVKTEPVKTEPEKKEEPKAEPAKEEAPKTEEPAKEEPAKQEEPKTEEKPHSILEAALAASKEKKEDDKSTSSTPTLLFSSSASKFFDSKLTGDKEPEKKEEPAPAPAPVSTAAPIGPAPDSDPDDEPGEEPMENQIDLFSIPAPEEPKPAPAPAPTPKPEPAPAPAPEKKEPEMPLMNLLSGSFLDDLEKNEAPTITHYEQEEPDPEPEDEEPAEEERYYPSSSLVKATEGEDIVISKVPEKKGGADIEAIWESIYSQIINKNYLMYAQLKTARLQQENDEVFIVFDNTYKAAVLKELREDALFKQIRDNILAVLPGARKVFVSNEKQFTNYLNRSTSVEEAFNEEPKEQSTIEAYLKKAQDEGIDIHFGDD